ncbi:hypothetical protein SAY86_007395 [Trapa natans]|uniref:Uncharacterized protein n=1 Tax=Trapa natans TaxID=22666 RepID=A0AAN7LLS3_TRANT|nr:hypothetical protein SAY86_007395 [Trapa natans]
MKNLTTDEDQDDANERWDDESDMEIDEQEPISSRVKRELMEPVLKDQDNQKANSDHLQGADALHEVIAPEKASDVTAMVLDEKSAKIDQEISIRPSDQSYPK